MIQQSGWFLVCRDETIEENLHRCIEIVDAVDFMEIGKGFNALVKEEDGRGFEYYLCLAESKKAYVAREIEAFVKWAMSVPVHGDEKERHLEFEWTVTSGDITRRPDDPRSAQADTIVIRDRAVSADQDRGELLRIGFFNVLTYDRSVHEEADPVAAEKFARILDEIIWYKTSTKTIRPFNQFVK